MTAMASRRRPTLYLMTDPARGDPAAAMRALPRGAAVIFRHYEAADREALARALRHLARARGLVFLVAGDPRLAARLGADGFHAPERLVHRIAAARRLMPLGLMSAAAHGVPGILAARRAGADAVLISPVFATASHPGARGLGPVRFAALARLADGKAVALGGMDGRALRRLRGSGAAGYAAIAAFARPPG